MGQPALGTQQEPDYTKTQDISQARKAREILEDTAYLIHRAKKALKQVRDNVPEAWELYFKDALGRDALSHLSEVWDCLENLEEAP